MKTTRIKIQTGIAILTANLLFLCATVHAQSSELTFQDDFTLTNAAWRFALTDTHDNSTAIGASYGKVQNGTLNLKANVGCGWDYLQSIAILDVPLPENFIVEYRANKTQFCGALHTLIAQSTTTNLYPTNQKFFDFNVAGTQFSDLIATTNGFVASSVANPSNSTFNYNQWNDYRIEKRENSLKIYVNNTLQYSYNGTLFSGGILHFWTHQAGATAMIDDLKIYDLSNPVLTIETAAIRLRWFAFSNAVYQIQWSTNLNTWSNLTSIVGTGTMTNFVDWTEGQRKFYRAVRE